MEENVFVSLGSNLGDREANIRRASERLAALPQTEVTGASRVLLTRAVGPVEQPDFLNQVQRLATALVPEELIERLLLIEKDLGRVRTVRWGPRVIDLDILFYGMAAYSSRLLVLPHPEVWNRPFFLELIREIDAGFLSQWDRARESKNNQTGKAAR
ncbi:MAG TPA: 2-amino-4-hydroxy-6-hydroxymethyldihydropteridine diphosphokinase [archaeon]|nr:2-amino-4-hydroxy-6-hydroxymethyldihydropteridine diphosphokinase [archaeon]